MGFTYRLLFILCLVGQFAFSKDLGQVRTIDSLNKVAIDHFEHYDLVNAMSVANEALELSRLHDDTYGSALASYTLGEIFVNLDEINRAKSYFAETIKFAAEIEDNYLLAMANIQLAEIIHFEGCPVEDAIDYFKKAQEYGINPNVTDRGNIDKSAEVMFLVHIGLAKSQIKADQSREAFLNIYEAKKYLIGNNLNAYNEGYYNFIFGKYYHDQELYASATEKFYQARESLIKIKENQANAKALLAEVYKTYAASLSSLGSDHTAYVIMNEYSELQTNILKDERLKYENIAKTKLDISNYKREAELAKKEKYIQADLKDRARQLTLIVVLASLLLLAAAIFFYKAYRSKRKVAKVLQIRNEQLSLSREKVLNSSKLKSEFISNVSHELRTPMYGVVGLTSMLANSQNLAGKDLHILNSLQFTSDYLLKLINNILQISKIEANEVVLSEEPTNLRILFQNVSDSFKRALEERRNKLVCKIDSKVPKLVMVDRLRLSQILMNLLGNSVKFTKNGTIHLSLEVIENATGELNLKFIVKDDGIGIPKHKQATIFEKFSQVTNKDDEFNRGTGLGLPISNKIAMLLGSKIELESEFGAGSEFSFEITCQEAVGQLDEQLIEKTNETIKPIQGRIRILVAEDNKINQMVTRNMLEKENFECVVAENGLLALEAFKQSTFDLVLMDINMPVMNGKDATLEIRKLNQQVPIFALTAADIQEIKEDSKALGFDEIVIKPFDSKELYRKIYTAVSAYKVVMASGKLNQVI